MCIGMYVYIYIGNIISFPIYQCVYIYIYVYIHVCVYIYIHTMYIYIYYIYIMNTYYPDLSSICVNFCGLRSRTGPGEGAPGNTQSKNQVQ